MFEIIISAFQQNAIMNSLLICLGFIFVDTLLGWIKAFKDDDFSWSKVPQFIKTNIFPYVGGLIILAIFSIIITELEAVFYIAVALVIAKFGIEAIKEKLLALF